jgi:hypothetical protein
MTPGTPRFPVLERVFRGYLHEDFAAEYGRPEAAVRAFRDDASPAEWRRFQREAKRFAAFVDGRDLEDVCTLVHRLGSRWTPPSREALLSLLTGAAELKPSDRR